jgi:hypothetical protein
MERRRSHSPRARMAHLLLLGLAALFHQLGCARNPVPATTPAARPSTPFSLRLTPPIVLSGGSVWVRCYAPQEGRRIRYGIEGVRMSEHPHDYTENRLLVERVPCGGNLVASCQVDRRRLEQALHVIGECP